MPLCIVVEDHPDTREGYVEYLGFAGLTVLAAGSAEELRALLATQIPDAIVMDLRLPKTDGWTLIRELKADQRTRDVPIIVVASDSASSDCASCSLRSCARMMFTRCQVENAAS
ncbi:MAG: response regulator [Acidobacteria bacterium]|nr:response regulator [Acidobacteriota bacterium]